MAPAITFLSDYGYDDPFVGICHGVIARICPDARIIDVTHGIARHDIRLGALTLRAALPYMPTGVHLAVVDPEVGAERRAVALRTADDRLLVGPDNGVLSLAAERCGGVVEAVDVARSPFRLEPVSATFHGRDIFAPVAASLAAGEQLGGAGDPLDPAELVSIELPRARREGHDLVTHAIGDDRFGNVMLDVTHEELFAHGLKLGTALEIELRTGRLPARFVSTFADVPPGTLLLYEDAQQSLALAINRGSAAADLEIRRDSELRIRIL